MIREGMSRHWMLAVGAGLTGFVLLMAALGPFVLPGDPDAQNLYATLLPPSLAHPFGTDAFGRDILLRIVHGARLALLEVALSLALALCLGVSVGVVAGFSGGAVDAALMWVMDVLFAFPGIVLAILAVGIMGPGLFNAMVAVALFTTPVYGRLARNLTLGVRGREYIQAAQTIGVGRLRIMVVDVLPNILPAILVQATLSAGGIILSVSSLSFLGLGAQPPLSEWGAMMSDGRHYLGVDFWPSLFPGLAIMITVFGLNCLGEALKERLEVR